MITIDPGTHAEIQPGTSLLRRRLTRFLHRARAAIALPGSVSVLLTSDAELRRLNRTFRRKDKPTDVLSFPADPIPGLPRAHQHAGDLAISLDTAARQAAEHAHTLDSELRILLLHGLLHLAGLDHETDGGEMAAQESALRSQLRLPNTLIARTQTPSAAKPPRPPRSSSARPLNNPPRPPSARPANTPPSSQPKSQSRDTAERSPHAARTSKPGPGSQRIPSPALRTGASQRRSLP